MLFNNYLLCALTVAFFAISFSEQASLGDNCTTPNEESAQCISICNCSILINTLKGKTLEGIKFLRESQCGTHLGKPLVCCGTKGERLQLTSTPEPSPEKPKSLLASRRICGYQHTDDRYYSKNETAIDEFPWMALLKLERGGRNLGYQCAATLINRRYLLTAAHCIKYAGDVKVVEARLGEYNLRNNGKDCVENPDFPECADNVIDAKVDKVIVHEGYHLNDLFSHDIAVIRLERNLKLTEFIRPICLPTPEDKQFQIGDTLITSGWGIDPSKGAYTPIKKRGLQIIQPSTICKEKSGDFLKPDSIICTSETGTDVSCNGDSGAPGMIKYDNQWQQEGILSFHFQDNAGNISCKAGVISVYLKVSDYIDWITRQVKP